MAKGPELFRLGEEMARKAESAHSLEESKAYAQIGLVYAELAKVAAIMEQQMHYNSKEWQEVLK